jgi:hypothetical protein
MSGLSPNHQTCRADVVRYMDQNWDSLGTGDLAEAQLDRVSRMAVVGAYAKEAEIRAAAALYKVHLKLLDPWGSVHSFCFGRDLVAIAWDSTNHFELLQVLPA